ncbi:hypothetical protein [Microcoleus sp. FACHB-68]|uniref:hypothetical protein n=1 Tax=Microcoleus sp. FACHB-68 TaxID=2692826 RepID=UPI001683921E|nr:hypothetical protein [Microcoleus sp. FACHB-68]MBD1940238.1 hypothetical protein [Microcoleus sp. FACHB-68]
MKIKAFNILGLLTAATWAASGFAFSLPVSAQPAILGNCGEQSCENLLEQLRKQWPEQISKYEANCQDNNTLGLQVFANEGEARKVMVACWGEKQPDGSRSGDSLAVLPFPGEEATFGSSWSCSEGECEDILGKLRDQSPDKIKEYETKCAMESGTLNLLISQEAGNKKVEVQCYFFSAYLIDDNGDGVADGDQQTGVDIILDTFSWPK